MPGRNRRRKRNKNGQQKEQPPQQQNAQQPKQPPPEPEPEPEPQPILEPFLTSSSSGEEYQPPPPKPAKKEIRVVHTPAQASKGMPAVSPIKRLIRDLAEVQGEEILTVSACPLEENIFEWHLNIKAPDGVYAGSYLHCVMNFPQTYPREPPTIRCLTPIAHPNVYDDGLICLSMLNQVDNQAEDNFEGWSSTYTVKSILLQFQTFFFVDAIRHGHGGHQQEYNADDEYYRNHDTVEAGIDLCKRFVCVTCDHSHTNPYPAVAIDKLEHTITMRGTSHGVSIDGTNVQTMVESWVGAVAEESVRQGRAMFEVLVQWTGDEWRRDNITGGLCRFGWGTKRSKNLGLRNDESLGYGGTAKLSYDGNFEDFGERFTVGDTITCALDYDQGLFWFGKNGRLFESIQMPYEMSRAPLYPMAAFKNARAEFNFGAPNRPVNELQDFIPMGCLLEWEKTLFEEEPEPDPFDEWYDLPDECSLIILRFLDTVSLYCASWSMRQWALIVYRNNLTARPRICCFYTKIPYGRCVLGFGLQAEVKDRHTTYTTQTDYVSNFAWKAGVRESSWGSKMDIFMPLIINPKHARRSVPMIRKALVQVDKTVRAVAIAKLMNDTVVNLSRRATEASQVISGAGFECANCGEDMLSAYDICGACGEDGSKYPPKRKIPVLEMTLSESALVAYASFHHMLLYFVENDQEVRNYAEGVVRKLLDRKLDKNQIPDLGQALAFISCVPGMAWEHIAKQFVEESWTRKILWLTRTNEAWNRPTSYNFKPMFKNTSVGRGVVMFQVLFAELVSSPEATPEEQLEAYNRRLGRPRQEAIVRLHEFCREFVDLTRNGSFDEGYDLYWDTLGFYPLETEDFIDLLENSVYRSAELGYHRPNQQVYAREFTINNVLQFNDVARERIEWRRRKGIRIRLSAPVVENGSGRGRGGGRGRGRNRGQNRGGGRGGQNQRNQRNPPRSATSVNEPADMPQRKKNRRRKKKKNNL